MSRRIKCYVTEDVTRGKVVWVPAPEGTDLADDEVKDLLKSLARQFALKDSLPWEELTSGGIDVSFADPYPQLHPDDVAESRRPAMSVLIDVMARTGWGEDLMLVMACRYIDGYDVRDGESFADWVRRQTDKEADKDGKGKLRVIKVEFDRNHAGGDYSGQGEQVFLTMCSITAARSDWETVEGYAEAVDKAFKALTGIDPVHIVRYSGEEIEVDATECDECGAPIPDDAADTVNPYHEKSCSCHPDNIV